MVPRRYPRGVTRREFLYLGGAALLAAACGPAADVTTTRAGGGSSTTGMPGEPQVSFRDGRIYLSGVTSDTPIAINFLITARVDVADGKPKVIVENVEAGRLPVPGALRSQVDDLVAKQERLIGDLPIYVSDVQIGNGKLVVTGQPK